MAGTWIVKTSVVEETTTVSSNSTSRKTTHSTTNVRTSTTENVDKQEVEKQEAEPALLCHKLTLFIAAVGTFFSGIFRSCFKKENELSDSTSATSTDSTIIDMGKNGTDKQEEIKAVSPNSSDTTDSNSTNSTSVDVENNGTVDKKEYPVLQIILPFLAAGMGTIGAGVCLSNFEKTQVSTDISALIILVPILSGLKGNLDMCLASRLSTQANLGNIKGLKKMIFPNLMLVQVQAIVATILGSLVSVYLSQDFDPFKFLVVLMSAMITASVCCIGMDLFMSMVVVLSYKYKFNPDNIATPLASSFGDFASLKLLILISGEFHTMTYLGQSYFIPGIFVLIFIGIFCTAIFYAAKHQHTKSILKNGWIPIIGALLISSGGGAFLNESLNKYKGFTLFLPIVNGVGGNLVSIQASRISTMLHCESVLGVLPENAKIFKLPWNALFNKTSKAHITGWLIALAICGQTFFMFATDYFTSWSITIGYAFYGAYILCVIVQVLVLLYLADFIVHVAWRLGGDPDNWTIPFLTSFGDLLGSGFLYLAFYVLHSVGHEYGRE